MCVCMFCMYIKCTSCFHFHLPAEDEYILIKMVGIPDQDILKVLRNTNLKKCNEACHHYSRCNSYVYNEKNKICGLSDVNPLAGELKPNDENDDVYIINPGQ